MEALAVKWIALGYNLPANPSKNRVYVWRKLRDCGAAYLRQGFAVLPMTPENRKSFAELAQKIRAMDEGDATLVEVRFVEEADERQMIETYQKLAMESYQKLLGRQGEEDGKVSSAAARETAQLQKLIHQYEQVRKMASAKGTFTKEMEQGFLLLMDTLRGAPGEFGALLRETLE